MVKLRSGVVTEIVKDTLGNGDFVVVELTKDGPKPVYGGDGQLLTFRSGEDATKEARRRTTSTTKFQPRRVKDDKWSERELNRFETKEYQPLPWAQDRWWRNYDHIHGRHFPHVSVRNSVGLMAYTANEAAGSADVQTPIKPGKYLEKFMGSILDPLLIRDLCTAFSNKFEDNCLLFGETEDEFEELYTKGPSSCMSHELSKYASHIHPVRVYAAGDLKLAYMKRDGRVVARALVYPDKKVYSRIYGDAGRFEPLLKSAGLRKGPPVGAKLQRVIGYENKVKKTGHVAFVLPHLDDCSWVKDMGDHLIVGDPGSTMPTKGAVKFIGAGGLSEWVSLRCPCCNKETTASNMKAVIVDADGHANWCVDCCASWGSR